MSSVPDTASEARMISPWRAEPEEGSTGSESFSILQPAHAEFSWLTSATQSLSCQQVQMLSILFFLLAPGKK